MNEIELSKYIDRIAETIVILTKRIQALEEQNASNSKNGHRKQAVQDYSYEN